MSRIVVDTNVLLYAVDNQSPRQATSKKLLNNTSFTLCTTSKNISELYYAATRGQPPILSAKDALQVLQYYRSLIEILYPSEASSQRFEVLLQRHQPRGLKTHDYEIAAIALSHNVNQIAIFNAADFEKIKEVNCLLLEAM